MQKIVVRQAAEPVESVVYVAAGLLSEIGRYIDFANYSKLFVVADEAVTQHVRQALMKTLPAETASITLKIDESKKQIKTIEAIWQAMLDAQCDRKSLIINFGGGVLSDIGGFAASTYMRGVDFINIPTTLLAQSDSSAGGKTGFNFGNVKNLIGTFDQPLGVFIDPEVLASLPERELRSGFAEIIKHGLIWDKTYFKKVTAKPPTGFTTNELADIIARSCQIKAEIIQDDLKEDGKRKLVNFGHTVGHALEALSQHSNQPLLHGEAISIGMVVEADLSSRLNLLSNDDLQTIKQAFTKAGLPVQFSGLKLAEIVDKMKSDKKNVGGQVNFTLLNGIGKAGYDEQVAENIVIEALQAASS